MKFAEYKYLVFSDLYRITGTTKFSALVRELLLGKESYGYNFWMRSCRYARAHAVLKFVAYPIAVLLLRRYGTKFGISIPFNAEIGSGLYIGHFGCIFVHPQARIGKNCNLSQDVTIGQANRGRNKGYPVIGDGVYIGPGARVIGAVRIGNNVAIGANCVVTKDVPDNAVCAGVPGRVISYKGAAGYVDNTEYDEALGAPSRRVYSAPRRMTAYHKDETGRVSPETAWDIEPRGETKPLPKTSRLSNISLLRRFEQIDQLGTEEKREVLKFLDTLMEREKQKHESGRRQADQ